MQMSGRSECTAAQNYVKTTMETIQKMIESTFRIFLASFCNLLLWMRSDVRMIGKEGNDSF